MHVEDLLKNSQFHRNVWYTWNPVSRLYTFFVPGELRTIHPVAVFSPLTADSIMFDPELVCDAIADVIARANPDEEYDIE
jgi:hypothetical protein